MGGFQFLAQKRPLSLILEDDTENNSNSGGVQGCSSGVELLLNTHKAKALGSAD